MQLKRELKAKVCGALHARVLPPRMSPSYHGSVRLAMPLLIKVKPAMSHMIRVRLTFCAVGW